MGGGWRRFRDVLHARSSAFAARIRTGDIRSFMRLPTVKLIFLREVRDQLRDRRTLFMIFVLPVLLYPALGLGMVQLTLRFGQEQRRIGLVGVENLPKEPPLLTQRGDRFDVDLFLLPRNQNSYDVLLKPDWTKGDLLAGKIDTLIIVPPGTAERLERGEQAAFEVLRNGTDDNSEVAYRSVLLLLDAWEERLVERRLASLGKGDDFANPIELNEQASDISPAAERSGTAWGRIFPVLLVMMALTGAFYPAIDLCAGEKERGTMETLLITPAARGEIVMGKFLTIFLFSVATTAFNLTSMGLTIAQLGNLMPVGMTGTADRFTPPSLAAIFWMMVLMLPLAGFFSAICMALAVFARSTKEGQYYLMPTLLVVAPLTFLTLVPGIELTPFYSLVPVTNVALLLRTLLLNQYETAMVYLLPVMVPTILYGYLALRYAAEQFRREEVLFREAERFSLGIWIRHLLRDKEATPTSAEAWFAFVLMLALLWYSQGLFPVTLAAQAATQLVIIAFPPIVLALLLTKGARRTLGLQAPDWTVLALAAPLAIAVHPVAIAVGLGIKELFPVSENIQEAITSLTEGATLPELLVVFALIPAICEEIAFRGFILAGLSRKHPPARAIVISAILFGIFHMVPQQMATASALGLILGLLAIRSGSILPGIVYHALHNGLVVLRGDQGSYGEGWVLAGGLGAALILLYLVRRAPSPRLPYVQPPAEPYLHERSRDRIPHPRAKPIAGIST